MSLATFDASCRLSRNTCTMSPFSGGPVSWGRFKYEVQGKLRQRTGRFTLEQVA